MREIRQVYGRPSAGRNSAVNISATSLGLLGDLSVEFSICIYIYIFIYKGVGQNN